MASQDTSSQWRGQIDTPTLLEDGKLQWRGKTYALEPPKNEILPPSPSKLTFRPNDIRTCFYVLLVINISSVAMLAAYIYFYSPPISSLIPVTGYLFSPYVLMALVGRWCGRRWYRSGAKPFRDFSGTKEEWLEMIKKDLLENEMLIRRNNLNLKGRRVMKFALASAGKEATAFGLRHEEIFEITFACQATQWFSMLGGELVRWGRHFDGFALYIMVWIFLVFISFPLGVNAGRKKEEDRRVTILRKSFLCADEEKAKSIVDLEWLIENLLVVQEDKDDKAQERRELIINPILEGIR